MPVDIPRLKRELLLLRSDRQANEEPVWDDIEKFILPLTGQTAQALQKSTVQQKTDLALWDLTAPLSAEHLASALHSDVTSPAARWLDLEWPDEDLEKDHDAVAYREAVATLAWNEFQASDFGMEIASGYHEWSGLGNMSLVIEPAGSGPEWKGLDCTAVPVRQTLFVEDSKCGVLRWYRHLEWTAVQMRDHCERCKCDVPQKVSEWCGHEDAAIRKHTVVFAVFRRNGELGTDVIPEELEGDAIGEKRPFGCVYFHLEEAMQLGLEDGYYKMPALQGRWGKRPGTPWGFGRGHIALRAVKWLNAFKETHRNAAEKAADPSLGVTERVAGPLDNRPGGVTVAPSKDDIWPIESAARFDVSVEVLRDERAEIRRCFHEDDLQLKESPAMTATEVQARRDQMNRAIGSPVARLQWDVLAPAVMIVLDHLSRAKKLPPMPDSVKQKKVQPRLRFRGPIARAQMMDEVVAIERSAGFIANLVKLGFDEARHYLNLGRMIMEHAKRLGSPMAMYNSEQDAQKAIQGQRQMAEAAARAQIAKDAGAGMASAAKAVPANGALAGVPGIGEQPGLVPSAGALP